MELPFKVQARTSGGWITLALFAYQKDASTNGRKAAKFYRFVRVKAANGHGRMVARARGRSGRKPVAQTT